MFHFHCQQLTFSYAFQTLFENLSFELKSVELLWLKGYNGSGKTTLLKCLAGLAEPESGQILWQDTPIKNQ